MINYAEIEISNIDDYEILLDIVDDTHIDQQVINMIKKSFDDRCKAILIEYPYRDKDYLSTYYSFYSKQFKFRSKLCFRLHFFGTNDDGQREYYGYITLRDGIKGSKIGRSYLSPKVLIDNKNTCLMLDKFSGVVFGEKLSVMAFPWMMQETDVSVCAHVAMWSILRYHGHKYHGYRDVIMGEIVDAVNDDKERKIPSRGLTPYQILDTFRNYKFSPVLLGDTQQRIRYFINEILTYIDSGIPVTATLNGKRHAIAVIGYEKPNISKLEDKELDSLKEPGTDIILSTSLIEKAYVIDDNFLPYRPVDVDLALSDSNIDYVLREISYIIIPYCDKVLYGFTDIYSHFMEAYKDHWMDWGKDIVCRIYIIGSDLLKQRTALNKTMPLEIKNRILLIDMPRFVWCIDISTIEEYKYGKMSGRLIADPTQNIQTRDIWLFAHDSKNIYEMGDEEDHYMAYICNPYDSFGDNLCDMEKVEINDTDIFERIREEILHD